MLATQQHTDKQLNIEHARAQSSEMVSADMFAELFTLAITHHQNGELQTAEILYRKILAVDPKQPNANHNLGILALDAKLANDSLVYFKTALEADPDEPQYWTSYIEALIKAGQYDRAREMLINGLERGLHGEEVNALVNELTKLQLPQKEAPKQNVNSTAQKTSPQQNKIKQYQSNPQIQQALALQQSGKLNEAKEKFTKLLKFYPNHPIILSCLGTIALQQDNIEAGVKWLEQSLAVDPNQTTALSVLSIAYTRLERFDEAIACCELAITINPNYAEAHTNCGNALRALQRHDEAAASYKSAIALKPNDADNYFNLGSVFKELKQYELAVASLQQGISLNPNDALAQCICADALHELKHFDIALSWYNSAIRLNNKHIDSYLGRGVVYLELKQFEAALVDFEHAIKLNPRSFDGFLNLGVALHQLGRFEEALIANQTAIDLNKTFLDAYNNRGLLLVDMQRLDEAQISFDKAIEIKANYAETYWNKSILNLLKGDFDQGWSLYEWRWETKLKDFKRLFTQPLWLGEQSIAGKTLLIYPEQGFGDFIQFCRYIPMVEALGAKVILETPKALTPLISTLKGNFKIVEQGMPLPDFDFHCPIMSLPLVFKTTVTNIPASVPYLYTHKSKQQSWQKILGTKTKFRVGLVWSGATAHKNDYHRSISFEMLKPLFSLPIEFHVLQKEIRACDIETLTEFHEINTHQAVFNDFSDTAALIQHMDLVISVDTSVAHLAAAMGKACWILLPYSPDFRWMLGRIDTPWYPSVTLFRQPAYKDWQSVIDEVRCRLQAKLVG